MELGSVVQFLENKTILVTGATGFLAKIFVEKILRTQPNVKKLFLLLRAADTKSATQRLHNEVIAKDLFRVLREKWGAELNPFISEKVTPVAGDISCENLAVNDSILREEMWREVDIVINLAATTNFDERYDVSLGINTMGPKHVLNFAKKCVQLKTFVHVSTAYVSGEREGLILENPCQMGESLNGISGLDIDAEMKLANQTLKKLEAEKATEATITLAMKDLGIKRYDISLGINTMGPKHVLNFAIKCVKLKTFVHVSTAYVSGEREGLILENPCRMGESLNGISGLDIDAEIKLVDQTLKKLEAEKATEATITLAMKDLGIKRAKLYGWPNTYVFTKAMGEMIVGHLKQNVSIVIIRPTIITSTYKEPFPGWVEGVRTIDSLLVGYCKGKLQCFLGDPNSIVDVIPADMVVNSIIVAMMANANHQSYEIIYQIGSSMRNPLRYQNIQDFGLHYFTEKPWINKDGNPVKVGKIPVLSTMGSFYIYMAIRYFIPLKGLELVNSAFCQYFRGTCTELNRKIGFVMRVVDLYRPYLFFKGVYVDTNIEKLQMELRESCTEADMFYFDSKSIDWEYYFLNIHLPGAVKYLFK